MLVMIAMQNFCSIVPFPAAVPVPGNPFLHRNDCCVATISCDAIHTCKGKLKVADNNALPLSTVQSLHVRRGQKVTSCRFRCPFSTIALRMFSQVETIAKMRRFREHSWFKRHVGMGCTARATRVVISTHNAPRNASRILHQRYCTTWEPTWGRYVPGASQAAKRFKIQGSTGYVALQCCTGVVVLVFVVYLVRVTYYPKTCALS